MTGPREPIHNGSLTPGHIYLYMEYLLYLYADHYPMMYGRSYTYIYSGYVICSSNIIVLKIYLQRYMLDTCPSTDDGKIANFFYSVPIHLKLGV